METLVQNTAATCKALDTYRVLIIDRDAGFRKEIRKALEALPLQKSRLHVIEVPESTEQDLKEHQPDIVLTQSNKAEVTEALRSKFTHVKFVLIGKEENITGTTKKSVYFFAESTAQLNTLMRQVINTIKKETVNKAGKSFTRKFLIALALTSVAAVIIYSIRPLWTIYFLSAVFVAGMLKKVLKIILAFKGKKDDRLECL